MALQLILGPSGSGKSEYIYDEIIRRTLADEQENYIVLVPEQYSLETERKIAKKHPRSGSFQIDVMGFNRLAYRVFEEESIKPAKVLEDFGKSMLIRLAAQEKKDELTFYGRSFDKSGFIDEVKSLMSEVYQYDIPREKFRAAAEALPPEGEDGMLSEKLRDMLLIFDAFEEKKGEAFLVAEQITELLTKAAETSDIIKNSRIVLDGFTGFTPIQQNLLSVLMRRAKQVTVLLTIDRAALEKPRIGEHELFALTRQTMQHLYAAAERAQTVAEEPVYLGDGGCLRWEQGHPLTHLEQNLFRYPYRIYPDKTDRITITEYRDPLQELNGVCRMIRELVMYHGYRYREIAVVSGSLEETADFADRIFPLYDIPYFIDMTRPVRHHPCVDAISHALRIAEENFSYDSVFSFLKSGVVRTLDQTEIELLENYVLAHGRKGYRSYCMPFQNGDDSEPEEIRKHVMEILTPVYRAFSGGKKKITVFTDAVRKMMETLAYREQFADEALYEKVCAIFDKMDEIMPEVCVDVREFEELFAAGMKDISLGEVPPMLDMLTVGDITRTRLSEIRTLFIVGVNDGVIPKRTARSQIINDREKERLMQLGVHMAPTERTNSCTEQFYLYLNMTKPKEALHLSYVSMSASNEPMRPSYILDRIERIVPGLTHRSGQELPVVTAKSGTEILIAGIQELLRGDRTHERETLQLYRLYLEEGDREELERIRRAVQYQNVPKQLKQSAVQMIRLKDMAMSVSKLEQYAQCAYAFYLKYILRLQERKIHGIDSRSVGVILHGAMEQIFAYVRDEMDNRWEDLDDSFRDAKTEEFVRENFMRAYEGQDTDDGAYDVLQKSLIRVAVRTVKKLQALMGDSLKPRYLEYSFRKKMTADGEDFDLVGVVDRGDLYLDHENHKAYLRVIDYKSGAHAFEIGRVYEGLELQLAVYTEVMTELVRDELDKKRFGEEIGEIRADGMYYYHMQDPFVEAGSEEEAEDVRKKQLDYNGIAQKDDGEFDTVIAYAVYKTGELTEKIKTGAIDKYPQRDGGNCACDYCTYKDVCRFDERYGHNRYHNTAHKAAEKKELLKEMDSLCHGPKNNSR